MPNYEIRKIQEIKDSKGGAGSSFSFIIPKKMATELGIKKGDYVKLMLDEESMPHRVILEREKDG